MTTPHPAVEEVRDLHRAFEHWLRDGSAGEHGGPVRFEAALGPRFRMVHPDGRVVGRGALLDMLATGGGSRPGLELSTRAEEVLEEAEGLALVAYEEWQAEPGGRPRGRHSTALLDLRGVRPVWLHVHETWCEEPAT